MNGAAPTTTVNVLLDSCAMPEVEGYNDVITVCNGVLLFHGPASACPNARQPMLKGGAPWWKAYGFLAPQECSYRCLRHARYGKCLLLNNGDWLWTRNYNPRHGAWRARELFVHSGQSAAWRGSAGCPTLPPGQVWSDFMGCFELDAVGLFVIRDCLPEYRGNRR